MSRELDPAKWETWRRRLRAFDREEATVASFCEREGVSAATFYLWRRKLGHQPRQRSQHGSEARARCRGSVARQTQNPVVQKSRPNVAAPVGFVPISITSSSAVEVWLPCGTRLFVPCHDREAIRTVIAALAHDRPETQAC